MKRSKHNLSHDRSFSANQGFLVPLPPVEVLPGDSFKHDTSLLCRLAPLNTPVMTPVHMTVHHWFVPDRILWPEFEDFITGGEDGLADPVFPVIRSPLGGFGVGSLADYLGINPVCAADKYLEVSALPFRAYAAIFNNFYRDEDLVDPVGLSKASGLDTTTNKNLLNVAWEKDYFTSARPWPQKGPDVFLPIANSAPVTLKPGSNPNRVLNATTGAAISANQIGGASGNLAVQTAGTPTLVIDPNGRLEADLSVAGAVSINELRELSAIQRFMENMSRHGSRYIERLLQLGIKSSDARLQLPEYLGGGSQTIQFSEVLQTAEGTDPVGQMRGHGIGAMKSNRYQRFFEEHGYVITLVYVKPKTLYPQATPRHWWKRDKFQFWQPELQHIGQMEILNKELYSDGSAADDGIWGYQDPYDDYRRLPSGIAGEFRTILDTWHMGRIFESRPALNADFVKANPTDRVYASSSTDVLYIMARQNIHSRRLVAKRGTSYLS